MYSVLIFVPISGQTLSEVIIAFAKGRRATGSILALDTFYLLVKTPRLLPDPLGNKTEYLD